MLLGNIYNTRKVNNIKVPKFSKGEQNRTLKNIIFKLLIKRKCSERVIRYILSGHD